jgi:hypothetical protein
MRNRSTPWLITTVLAFALWSGSAASQPRDRAAADALFQAARAEFDSGDFASACEKFAESNRLDPAPGTLLNLSLCLEKIGKVASAWEGFRQVAERLRDERVDFAKDRSTALESRLPWLTLRLPENAPEGTRVFRDGIELRQASLGVPLPVDPGPHILVTQAPGHLKSTATVRLDEGQREEVVVAIGPLAPTPPTPVNTASSPKNVVDEPPKRDRTFAWIAGGISAVGIGTSLATGALALSSKNTVKDRCVDRICDEEGLQAAQSGRTYATISTVAGAVGLLGLATGTYLLIASGQEKEPFTRVEAVAIPGGSYLGMSGRF